MEDKVEDDNEEFYSDNDNIVNPYSQSESFTEILHAETYNSYCEHCDMNFEDLIQFERHNTEVHSLKLLTCQVCTATFRRQDHLKRHMRSLHSDQKYCCCPVCGKDCKRQDLLAKHVKQKHGNKSEVFKCRDCGLEHKSLVELEKHESSHLLSDRHTCPHCSTTFKRRDHMLRHIKSQHLNHVVPCPLCGQVYKRRDHVARHIKEKHKMGLLNGKLVKAADIVA